MYGKVEKIWPKSTVFVIGGGPSILDQDLSPLKDRHVLGVNNAVYLPFADVLFFGDAKWYWWNVKAVREFSGPKYTLNKGPEHGWPSVENEPGLTLLKLKQYKHMYMKGPEGIGWNKSSGAAAINVAVHLGAKRIVLLGYDMRNNGRKNWMPHEWEHTKQNPYEGMSQGFQFIKKSAIKYGIEILNATPGTALKIFPRIKLNKLL